MTIPNLQESGESDKILSNIHKIHKITLKYTSILQKKIHKNTITLHFPKLLPNKKEKIETTNWIDNKIPNVQLNSLLKPWILRQTLFVMFVTFCKSGFVAPIAQGLYTQVGNLLNPYIYCILGVSLWVVSRGLVLGSLSIINSCHVVF